MTTLDWLIHTAAFKGAITGFLPAVAIDLHVLMAGQDWSVLKTFNWNKATFRWVVGLVGGALTAVGYGALIG